MAALVDQARAATRSMLAAETPAGAAAAAVGTEHAAWGSGDRARLPLCSGNARWPERILRSLTAIARALRLRQCACPYGLRSCSVVRSRAPVSRFQEWASAVNRRRNYASPFRGDAVRGAFTFRRFATTSCSSQIGANGTSFELHGSLGSWSGCFLRRGEGLDVTVVVRREDQVLAEGCKASDLPSAWASISVQPLCVFLNSRIAAGAAVAGSGARAGAAIWCARPLPISH